MRIFRRWLSDNGFYLAPDEGGGAASAASAASQGAASQAPASTSGSAAGGTGGATSTAPSGAASSSTSTQAAIPASAPLGGETPTQTQGTAAATQPEWQSVVDIIQGYGATDLATQFRGNEHGLLQHLLMERARAQQYDPVVRQLQENGPAWQDFLRQRAAAQQQQTNDPWYSKWFKPPEWNAAWERQITVDANGNVGVVPGADPGLVRKYQEYRQYRQQVADKFLANPYEFFKEPVQQLAREMAQQEVQRHLGGYQDRVFADNFVQSNPWLFAKDQNGQPIVDPRNGSPVLSPEGAAYRNAVVEANQMGLSDVRAQHKYAMAIVQRDASLARIQALSPQQQQQQANQQFLQQAAGAGANHQESVGPATSPAPANGNHPPPPGNVSFDSRAIADRLMRNMAAAGYQPGQVLPTGSVASVA